jgi:Putative adhesin
MIRTLTAALILATATAALADADFDRTLTVSGQADLYVSTGSGHIKVTAGSDSQITVKAHIHAGWGGGGDMDARIRRIVANPPIVQTGNTVRIGETNDRELYNHISIDYEITAPATVALNLRSGSGDVDVEHLGRFISATSGSGSVVARGIHGPANLQTGSGDIELQQEAAGEVKAQTGSGSIRINGLNGALTARTGSGDIQADGHLTGAARLSSGSGSVRLNLAPDAHFDLEGSTGSGSIHVHFPNAPQQNNESRHHLTGAVNGGGPVLEARTGSGDIDINNSYSR